jgi:hypothetical protein
MNESPSTDYSNVDLRALARTYQAQTERLERIMLLPIGYHVGFAVISGAHGSRTWELNVFHADESDDIDFDTPIAQGTRQEVETALHTLMAADHAHRRTLDHYATTPVEPSKPEPKAGEWHSRFENIERPTLLLEHDPGWTCIDAGDPVGNSHFIFRSHNEQFGLDFDVLEDDTHEPNIGMLQSEWDWDASDPSTLLTMGGETPELQKWLNDCAAVAAWVNENNTMKEARNA